MPGDLESGGRDVCMLERQSDRDLYWGPDFRREGVLMCSCVRVWGRERLVWGRAEGLASDKSEVSVFEGL